MITLHKLSPNVRRTLVLVLIVSLLFPPALTHPTLVSTVTAQSGTVTVTVDRNTQTGTSEMAVGVTHTQNSLDPWADPDAVARGKELLREGVRYQNQHIYGWGTVNINPEPGVYNWLTLDRRVQLMRDTGAIPIITLCCAPDWMTSLGTNTSRYPNKPPTAAHIADFADLAQRIAERYPDVQNYVVWNEMKGLWNRGGGQWDYVAYTAIYNAVYDALKAVNPNIQVGGPYLVIDGSATDRGPWFADTPLVRRNLMMLDYWMANAHGADFVAIDRKVQGYHDHFNYTDAELLALTPVFGSIAEQVRTRYGLPVWYIEQHFKGKAGGALDLQAVGAASMLLNQLIGGTAVSMQWEPERNPNAPNIAENLYSSAHDPGGAQPFPSYYVYKLFHEHFAPGTSLFATTSSAPEVEVLASDAVTLILNKFSEPVDIDVDGTVVTLTGYEVRLLDANEATILSITESGATVSSGASSSDEVDGPNSPDSVDGTIPPNTTPGGTIPDVTTPADSDIIFLPIIKNGVQSAPSDSHAPSSAAPVDNTNAAAESSPPVPDLVLPGDLDATMWDRPMREQIDANLRAAREAVTAAINTALTWFQQYSAFDSDDRVNAIAADSTGAYVVGSTYGSMSGGIHAGHQDAYIRRYDAAGTELWTRQYGNSGDGGTSAVAIYESGSDEWIYVAGTVDNPLDGQTAFGLFDGYLRKYDNDGSVIWMSYVGGAGDDFVTGVAVDESGVYLAGHTDDALDGQPWLGYQDAFVRKVDYDGNHVWTRQFGSESVEYADSIAIGAAPDGVAGPIVYVGGATAGALDGQTHLGFWDNFLRAYDGDGNELWTRQFGTPLDDRTKGVAATYANDAPGVYIGGYVEGALGGQTFHGIYDNFIRKYDANGDEVWTQQFGTPWEERVVHLSSSANGISATGWTRGAFGTATNAGNADITIHAFDAQGNLLDEEQIGSGGQDEGKAISSTLAHRFFGGDTNAALPGQTYDSRVDAFVGMMPTANNIIAADEFDRTLPYGWRMAETGGYYRMRFSWLNYATNNDAGHFFFTAPATGYAATLTNVSAQDVDIRYAVQLDNVTQGGSMFTYVAARYMSDTDEYRGQVRFKPNGTVSLRAIRYSGGWLALANEVDVPNLTYDADTKVWVRMEATGTNPTTLRMKAWAAHTAEPADWLYTATDNAPTLQTAGSVGFRAYATSYVQNTPLRVSFDDLLVRGIGP